MGIKKINEFLRGKSAECSFIFPLKTFSGFRIAIDACLWIYKNYAVERRMYVMAMKNPLDDIDYKVIFQHVMGKFMNFNRTLVVHGITPVWVWDGKPYPEKAKCREERKDEKISKLQRVEEFRTMLQNMKFRDIAKEKEFRMILATSGSVSSDDIKYMRSLGEGVGFSSLSAPHDGEILCSALTKEGLAVAAWSTDTDNYSLGSTIIITEIVGKDDLGNCLVRVVIPYLMPKILGITRDQFVDFCIMCGGDFNENVYGIGPCKAFNLIKKYGNIDNIIINDTKHDYKCLCHLRCREIINDAKTTFQHDDAKLNFNTSRFMDTSREILQQNNLFNGYNDFITELKNLPAPRKIDIPGFMTVIENTFLPKTDPGSTASASSSSGSSSSSSSSLSSSINSSSSSSSSSGSSSGIIIGKRRQITYEAATSSLNANKQSPAIKEEKTMVNLATQICNLSISDSIKNKDTIVSNNPTSGVLEHIGINLSKSIAIVPGGTIKISGKLL